MTNIFVPKNQFSIEKEKEKKSFWINLKETRILRKFEK
jgi:hypothetical protein